MVWARTRSLPSSLYLGQLRLRLLDKAQGRLSEVWVITQPWETRFLPHSRRPPPPHCPLLLVEHLTESGPHTHTERGVS